MSLLGATILTAIATLALAVFAFTTAILALLAWRKQSREVSDQAEMLRVQSEQLAEYRNVNAEQIRVLGLQAEEFREAAQERRRAQAVQVYLWQDGQTARVRNASQQPIYSLAFTWLRPQDGLVSDLYTEHYGPLLPGEEETATLTPTDMDSLTSSAAVFFSDRAGVRWRTDRFGKLEEWRELGEYGAGPDRTSRTVRPERRRR